MAKKTSVVWLRQAMRAASGIASPARPNGLAAPVPVLVERAHGIGGRRRETETRDDRGAAIAARLDDRLALGHERAQHRERALGACDAPAARHVLRGVARDRRRLRPVDELAVRLERDVVGAEQLAHASGGRRAAHVLEQKRVVEGVPGLLVEPQLVRQAHADEAAALGLADGLPLGHVERMRERGDDLGLAHLSHSARHELHARDIGLRSGI